MDRVTIKENAKKMRDGNVWYLWKPLVAVAIATFIISFIAVILDSALDTNGIIASIGDMITGIISSVVAVGYSYYCLQFVRGNKIDYKEVFIFAKDHWVIALLTTVVVGLNIFFGTILLIVPGIMASLGLTLYAYVVADNPELTVTEALKKSWDITNGYKVDLLVFYLSFLGWILLIPLTLGIMAIWVVPYMTIAETLVYETLKK